MEHKVHLIVVGDAKSPDDFNLNGCDFYSLSRQHESGFSSSRLLPENHYSRKNIGYLAAIQQGTTVLTETDDDNYAADGFWNYRPGEIEAELYENCGWLNIYRFFSEQHVWPRGFPLSYISQPDNFISGKSHLCFCPIQQGLADINPDVDAVFRLVSPQPVVFEKRSEIAIGSGTWCPFNSQNTVWFPEAFPLLYLPSFCSFRMTDIWRSLVAQRICWENRWKILFHEPTVWQERNKHDLMCDFRDELPGYLNNAEIVERLAKLSLYAGPEHIAENMLLCYQIFIDMKLIDKKELVLMDAWFRDLCKLR